MHNVPDYNSEQAAVIMPGNPITVRGARLALILLAASGSAAAAQGYQILIDSQVEPQILTTPRGALQGGAHPAVRYYSGNADQSTQVVRGNLYVQCFASQQVTNQIGKRVTFDQNRPFEPRLVSTQEMGQIQQAARALGIRVGALDQGRDSQSQFMVQAGELLEFGKTEHRFYTSPGQPPEAVLYVEDVNGACYPVQAVATTSLPPPQCGLYGHDSVANDRVFRGQFEPQQPGELKMAVEVTPGLAGSTVSYTYTMWADGGPVYDIQLREQFPFYEDGEDQPVYGKSMRLEHPWSCSATGEAHCGDGGREQVGMGYLVTNAGHLARPATINGDQLSDGACLQITVQGRAVRHDGFHNNMAFSNSLQVAARYTSWAGDPQQPGQMQVESDRFIYQRTAIIPSSQ